VADGVEDFQFSLRQYLDQDRPLRPPASQQILTPREVTSERQLVALCPGHPGLCNYVYRSNPSSVWPVCSQIKIQGLSVLPTRKLCVLVRLTE
jgi:hypothetical protein